MKVIKYWDVDIIILLFLVAKNDFIAQIWYLIYINVLILKLTDWLLGKHFEITSLLSALIFAILLSISTFIVNEIIKKIIDKVKR